MEFNENGAKESRTKRITKCSWVIFGLIFFLSSSEAMNDFDEETYWLKNITVQLLPVGSIQNQSIPLLKIAGLATAEIKYGVRIKPTLLANKCLNNEADLQIINDAPLKNSINHTTDLIVSFNKFDFKRQPAAYLCIKTENDQHFIHMGSKSKFPK